MAVTFTASEVASARWRKASFSGNQGGNCVEVARVGGRVAVRDSTRPAGDVLAVRPSAWRALLTTTATGVLEINRTGQHL